MQTLPRKAIEQYLVVVKKFENRKPKNQVKNQIVRYEKRKDHSLNLCQGNLWPEKKVKQVGEKGDEKITCHMCVKRNVIAVVSTKPIKLWKKSRRSQAKPNIFNCEFTFEIAQYNKC